MFAKLLGAPCLREGPEPTALTLSVVKMLKTQRPTGTRQQCKGVERAREACSP
jgi:hypothetical protein